MPPTPSGAPRYTRTQRRLLTVSAGLGVAVLAGVAFVVTYGDLRALVVEGHAPRRFAPAYPVMFDALITVTILALVMARNTRWWIRWPRWLLLLVLLAGAGAASVQRATKGYGALPDEALKAGVAVAPHVMLLLVIWLWLAMFRQARQATAPDSPADSPADESPLDEADGPRPPTVEVPAGRLDSDTKFVPGFDQDYEPKHQQAGELADDQPGETPEDAAWPNPWVQEEAPLDWALVPYDPEPAPPYEPDPAVQPYEPDPVQPYRPDPAPETIMREEPERDPAVALLRAPSSLPTDIKLVGRPAATTQPDLVVPGLVEPATEPAADLPAEPAAALRTSPAAEPAGEEDDDGADIPVTDRAEDPDAGDDHPVAGLADDTGLEAPESTTDDVERWSAEAAEDVQKWADDAAGSLGTDRPAFGPEQTTEVEWTPPSSTFRSSPTPPDD
jgi:hypothetical protein